MRTWRARCAGIAAQFVLCIATAQDGQNSLEKQAADAFDKRDCATASRLYTAALESAKTSSQWSKVALFYRRIGICAYRAGEVDAALAAYDNGVKAAEAAKDHDTLLENLHGSAVAMRHLGRLKDAMAAAEGELAIAETCHHTLHLARAYSEVALLAGDLGQEAKAEQYLQKQLDFARSVHDNESISSALENLAVHYGATGDPEAGIRILRQAMSQLRPDDEDGLGRLQANLAVLYKQAGHFAEAQTYYEEALRHSQRPESWRNRQTILYDIGLFQVDRGNLSAARKALEESVQVGARLRDPQVQAMAKEALGSVMLELKQPAEARQILEEALDIARRSGSPAALFATLGSLGRTYDALGKTVEAGAALEEAAAIVESLRAAAPGDPVALSAILKNGHPVYQLMVGHLLSLGRVEEALAWADKSKARVLNDLVIKGGLDERSVMSDDERREERRLYGAVSRTAADRKRSTDAIAELETFRRQLYRLHPELALQRADFAAGGLTDWRKLLPGPGSALIDYYQLIDSTVAFVITERTVRAVRIPAGSSRLSAEIRTYTEQLAARDINYQDAARSLFRKLIGPVMAVTASTDKWIVSPDGVLWELPFHTLIGPGGKHLLETHTVSYTPSLNALWAIRQREQRTGAPIVDLLAVGNPALPEAEDEAHRVAQMYSGGKAVALTGSDARQDRFREQAPRAGIIHIATHAELNAANPMYSTLALSPGTLTASELLRMPLHARLAVLSACETARGKAAQGEELLGMGWALAGAGVSASIVSEWKVDSAATEQLMIALHRNLRTPMSAAEALRSAALEIRSHGRSRNPFYWAGFLVLGDGFR